MAPVERFDKLPERKFTVQCRQPANGEPTKEDLRRFGRKLEIGLMGFSDIGRLDQLQVYPWELATTTTKAELPAEGKLTIKRWRRTAIATAAFPAFDQYQPERAAST